MRSCPLGDERRQIELLAERVIPGDRALDAGKGHARLGCAALQGDG